MSRETEELDVLTELNIPVKTNDAASISEGDFYLNNTLDQLVYDSGGVTAHVATGANEPSLYATWKDATCTITSIFGITAASGSGFFVNATGRVVTCAHVVLDNGGGSPGDAKALEVFIDATNCNGVAGNNQQVICSIVGVDRAADTAVLQAISVASNPNYGFDFTTQPFLSWATSTTARKGATSIVIGNPFGVDDQSISTGVLRDNKYLYDGFPVEQIFSSSQIISGNSGSPVLNHQGKILGLACWSYQSSVNGGGGGSVPVASLMGGTSQYMAEQIVALIVAGASDYTAKGYLGLDTFDVCNGLTLRNLRVLNAAFRTGSKDVPAGIAIAVIDALIAPFGLNNAVITGTATPQPLLVNDIITHITDGVISIDVGVFDNEFSPSRVTWFNPASTVVTLTFTRPSTNATLVSDVTLDTFPVAKDVVGGDSLFAPIDTLITPL